MSVYYKGYTYIFSDIIYENQIYSKTITDTSQLILTTEFIKLMTHERQIPHKLYTTDCTLFFFPNNGFASPATCCFCDVL